MSNRRFSYKYRQLLLLKHILGGVAALAFLAIFYWGISALLDNQFYTVLESLFGQDFAHVIHNYEPAVIAYAVTTVELLVWIIIEVVSSRKLMKTLDSIDAVLDPSIDSIALPAEFSGLQNRLNILKMQNRDRQRIQELETQKKSDALTYLAHDIRTPLASVVGYLSLLCEAPDMPEEQRSKFTRTAFQKALQFEKLTDDFFDITRYNLSEKALCKKEVDLCFLLEQLSDEFYPLLQEKELKMQLSLPDALVVSVDGEKIARAFINVIKNAITYSYPQTTITICLTSAAENIVAAITNCGSTIPADKLAHIFDKFYRAEESYPAEEKGTGLGLAIAKEIVRMHNGSINATSAEETTVFTIILPVAKE